jgi:hypothetical protein
VLLLGFVEKQERWCPQGQCPPPPPSTHTHLNFCRTKIWHYLTFYFIGKIVLLPLNISPLNKIMD